MTQYNFPHKIVPSEEVQKQKEERKKLLEMIWQRRRENYKRLELQTVHTEKAIANNQ